MSIIFECIMFSVSEACCFDR